MYKALTNCAYHRGLWFAASYANANFFLCLYVIAWRGKHWSAVGWPAVTVPVEYGYIGYSHQPWTIIQRMQTEQRIINYSIAAAVAATYIKFLNISYLRPFSHINESSKSRLRTRAQKIEKCVHSEGGMGLCARPNDNNNHTWLC